MRHILIQLFAGLLLMSVATASEWKFSETEEDWGLTCFSSVDLEGFGTLGFMAVPGGPRAAYLDGDIKGASSKAKWQLKGLSWSADGEKSDYFGWHEYYELPLDFVEAVGAAETLQVVVADGATLDVPLNGSGKAVQSFLDCAEG
jgi:hypothetical protein